MSSEGLVKFIKLVSTEEDIRAKLQQREREHRIREVIGLAKEHRIDLSVDEVEQFIATLQGTRTVEEFVDEFGADVSFDTLKQMSRMMWP